MRNFPIKSWLYTHFLSLFSILFFSVLFFGTTSGSAIAATVLQNLNSDIKNGSNLCFIIGSGHSFTPTGVRVGGTTYAGRVGIEIVSNFDCWSGGYGSGYCGTLGADAGVIATTSDEVIEFTYTGAAALDPTKTYDLNINLNGSTPAQNMWGSSAADPNGFTSCNGLGAGQNSGYYEIAGTGGFTPPPPADTSTRLIVISPAQNEVASSSPDIAGTFYNQSPVYDQLLVNLSWVEPSVNADLLLSGLAHRQFIFDIGTSTSNQTFSTTTSDLLTGRWLLSAQFSSGSDGFNYFTATTTTFVVGTTTTFFSDYVEYATTTATTTDGAPISSCTEASSVLEKAMCALGDRIRDVLQFVFVPDATTLGRFGALKDNIMSRVPFGYFPLFKSALDGVSASSTPIFAMVVPIASLPRFGDIRTGLGWVFLFWFVVHMWRRFKHVDL